MKKSLAQNTGRYIGMGISTLVAALSLAGCSSNSGNSSSPKMLMVANEAMANGQVVFANPDQGGLVGNLYIEPRNLMLAPDTTIVGCSQNGSGALGIDAYLAQPTWITQSLIYTQLYVPEENFRLGFPAGGSSTGLISVDSYFATDTFGNFHLADGDVEGDYQFALVADDAARLYLGSPGAMSLYVDDQKPAGSNNGCLEQTQPAHMSCTNNWSSQTAADVVTVHLAPGQILSMELQYWQGPGEGIAMMAFYRPVPSAANQLLDSTNCGQEENFAAGSTQLTALQQSWHPITMQNLSVLLTQ
jgi:hypothetical protein